LSTRRLTAGRWVAVIWCVARSTSSMLPGAARVRLAAAVTSRCFCHPDTRKPIRSTSSTLLAAFVVSRTAASRSVAGMLCGARSRSAAASGGDSTALGPSSPEANSRSRTVCGGSSGGGVMACLADAVAIRVTGRPKATSGGCRKSIVWGIRAIGNDPRTASAAANRSLPAWLAVMAQVPALIAVAVRPETVHTSGVSEVKDTASFDVADADRVTRLSASAPLGGGKLIVWVIFWTGKDLVTESAGAYQPLPGWEAMMQVPAEAPATAPETVHTRRFCELYDTARPVGQSARVNCRDHDDAVRTTGTPTVVPGTGPDEIR
jgi:hypothetical protein